MRIRLVREDRIALPGEDAVSIAKPINDLLGLRDDERYADWLANEWPELAPSRTAIKKLDGLREDLSTIASAASKSGGSIDYARLAPLLSQVRHFAAHRELEIPSLAVLAAWALERVVHGSDVLVECPTCGQPWFTRGPAKGAGIAEALIPTVRPCSRPAPGLTLTCAQLAASDRFARERSAWSKEYRKVMARKLRGTVSEKDFRAWKAVSNPGKQGEDWTPFDEWKEQHG